jgi:hypothetical protein
MANNLALVWQGRPSGAEFHGIVGKLVNMKTSVALSCLEIRLRDWTLLLICPNNVLHKN